MPAQVVSAELDAVPAAEIGHAVGLFPVPHALGGVNLSGFHDILGRNAVEFPDAEGHLLGCGDIGGIDGYADGEIPVVGVFESLRTGGGKGRQQEQDSDCQSFHESLLF